MNSASSSVFATRDDILKCLSDDEVASVSMAETTALAAGDEFLDLERLDRGVLRAQDKIAASTAKGNVLAKRAVHERTWSKIIAQLAAAKPTLA